METKLCPNEYITDQMERQFDDEYGELIEQVNIVASTLVDHRPPWELKLLIEKIGDIFGAVAYRVDHEVVRN